MTDPGSQNPSAGNALFSGVVDAVRQKAVTSQENARTQDQQLGRADVDAPYVNAPEPPPETMTHQQIYQAATSIDKSALWELVTNWARTSTTMASIFQLHRMGVDRVLGGRWEGAAGEAAHEAAMKLAQAGERMGEVAESVGLRLDSMHNAVTAFAAAVPPPPAPSAPNPDNPAESVLPNLISGAKDRADTDAATVARKMAIDAVNRIYLPLCPPAGQNVPAFIPPPTIGGGDSGTAGGGGTGAATGGFASGGGTGAGGGPASGDSAQPGRQGGQQDQTTPASADPAATAPANASANSPATLPGVSAPGVSGQSGVGAAPTAPAGVSSAGWGGPGGVTGSGAGGYPGIGGRGASGSGVSGPGVSRPGVPGSGVSGSQGLTGPRAAGAGAAGSMGPMSPGALGKRKDEDTDRTKPVPDYLKQVQPELADLPPAATGAIGGDYATWQAPSTTSPQQRTSPATPGSSPGTGLPVRYDDPIPDPAPPAQDAGR
ncbi:hypothetical protein [Nocardia terpenica]|nr:hypothetical protein [Nocardia terpenica]